MARLAGAAQRASSMPLLSHLAGSGIAGSHPEVVGGLNAALPSLAGPLFELELDASGGTTRALQDRCFSQQQFTAGDAAAGGGGGGGTSLLQQVLALCRCSSPVQAQLLHQLQRLRTSACAGNRPGNSAAAGSLSDGSGHSSDAAACVLAPPGPDGPLSCATAVQQPEEAGSLDIEAMACELLALGYLVQVRDGAQQQQQERSKTPRSCLQRLRHRFIVCLGVRGADEAPVYLSEPLVVEPRFKEQLVIAHPTSEYEALLQSIPECFVGPVGNLEAVIKLVCEQMVAAFKLQGLPVPPWRTRTALLSKWSPAQLAELAGKIASLRRLAAATPPSSSRAILQPCQSHDQLYNSDRPAAAHADHAAVGSAPNSAAPVHSRGHAAAVAAGASRSQQQQQQQPVPLPAADAAGAPPASNTWALHGSGAGVNGLHQQQGQPAAQAVPGPHLAAVPAIEQPSAAVLALLAANAGMAPAGGAGGAAFKFTRKASAEWKHQRSTSRNIRGLLAAALGSTTGVGRCSTDVPAGCGASQAAVAVGPSATSATQQPSGTATAAAPSSDAFIRHTHFRAACDEPWRRITTVRLGALSQQQQHEQQQQQPQQPSKQ